MRSLQLLLVALAFASPIDAQLREYRFVPELTIDLTKENIRRGGGLISVSPSGRMLLLTEFYRGQFRAFDTTGNELWSLDVGRNDSEIGWVQRIGWLGGDSVWVADQRFDQAVIVDPNGKIVRTVEKPSWVRPRWKDRRRFPFFSSMDWLALHGDGTMLVFPAGRRTFFDTPGFDRESIHLFRVDRDGRILKEIARLSREDGQLQLRDGVDRRSQRVDFFARNYWGTSGDGRRIVIVTPLIGAADSGAFGVTSLNDNGDTVFSRRYTAATKRLPQGRIDSSLARIKPFGRHTAGWIRDTVRKLTPVFDSPVVSLSVGVDQSTWVWLRTPGGSPNEWTALIIDAQGNAIGTAKLPRSFSRGARVSVDRVWSLQRPTGSNNLFLERWKRVDATAARPSRSAPVSARSARPTPRG